MGNRAGDAGRAGDSRWEREVPEVRSISFQTPRLNKFAGMKASTSLNLPSVKQMRNPSSGITVRMKIILESLWHTVGVRGI